MTRLDSVDPNLAIAFRGSPFSKQRRAVVEACRIAVGEALLDDGLVDRSLSELGSGASPDSSLIVQLEELSARLDNEYFKLDAAGDASSLSYFSKARAASSIAFALHMGTEQFIEAVYEAVSAVDDPSRIAAAVYGCLY